jgi:IclR family KDG regulon transcriptional repressor
MDNENSYIIPMVDKTFEIIDYMYKFSSEVGVSQISQDLNLPKATVFRILSTVSKWGYVEKTEDSEKYILGKAFIKIGAKVSSETDIMVIAAPFINELAKDVGESINLGIIYEGEILTIYNAKGEDFYLISKLIPVSPLNCSGMGKLYLSKLSIDELYEYFNSNKPEIRTINSVSNLDGFLKLKEEIEKEGISFDREEYEYGLTCIAAPINDINGNLIAAISISGPTTRLQYKGMDNLKTKIIDTANAIAKSYSNIYSLE